MKPAYVVDTNVGVVANNGSKDVTPRCVEACVEMLLRVQSSSRLVIDDKNRIVTEYMRHLSPKGQPGAGDAFMRWIWNNQFNEAHCLRITITPRLSSHGEDFEEFPDDPDLAQFDHSDRKFAAVAKALVAPVLNATDSDWWNFREPLSRHSIEVKFICPERFEQDGSKRSAKRTKKKR
jgi:hypothetical protein